MYSILGNVIYCSVGFLIFHFLLTIVASRESLRYYIKCSSIAAAIIIPTSLQLPFMFLRMGDWRNALFTVRILRAVVKLVGVTHHIRGKENIVKDSGSIVLVNHQSMLDIVVLAELCPLLERCIAVMKKELLYYGPFGLAAWASGSIFIDRQNNREAQKTINGLVKYVQDFKRNVVVFPEGTRHCSSALLPFKKGAFHLAIDTQLPILPIVISKYYFFNSKRKIFNSGTSYITILPPIPTKGLTKEDLPKLMEDAYRIMNKSFIELSQAAINEHVNFSDD